VVTLLAGQVELALQIFAGDVDVSQRHADIAVAEQAHEGW
jgi:hypothetical protein